MKKDKWETVFEYKTPNGGVYKGSKCVTEDGIEVSFTFTFKGDVTYGTHTSSPDEESAQMFFYRKLRDMLGGSWLPMQTIGEHAQKPFKDKIKKLKDKMYTAKVKKYQEIMGPLNDITYESLEESAKDIKSIMDDRRKGEPWENYT